MKQSWYKIWVIFLLLVPASGLGQEELKIISWNIWNGFDFGKDPVRKQALGEWLAKQAPDIVALQELCTFDEQKLAEFAQSWGHEYSLILKKDGYPVGITSKEPIILNEKIREGMHHGALHCQTFGIDIFVIHFSPSSFAKRREEAAIILDRLGNIRAENDHYVVMGDFNAPSPIDADLYDPEGELLQRLRKSNADKPETGNLFHQNLDYAVISALLAFPLMDVCQPFTRGLDQRWSFPGLVLKDHYDRHSEEQLRQRQERIDFILTSPELGIKCTKAYIKNYGDATYLSDHYPVIATFNW